MIKEEEMGYNGYSSYGTPKTGDRNYSSYVTGKLAGETARRRENDIGSNTGKAVGFFLCNDYKI